jgi:hypothetical protein
MHLEWDWCSRGCTLTDLIPLWQAADYGSISRVVTLGSFQRLQLDDWLMVVIVVCTGTLGIAKTLYSLPQVPFTAMVATADGSDSFSTSTDAKRRLKMRFALEELQLTTNWLIKACLIILYRRIL